MLPRWSYPSVEQISLHRENRRAHRFPFLASAEVAEGCGEAVAARVSELSIFGCHLLMSNPFSEGASILLKILVMRPLIVHASSKSLVRNPRRVLHVEYFSSKAMTDGLELAVA